jgi:toxin ParE1/3/4
MRPYLLTSAARKDLIDIGRFTTEKWGKRQRDKYLKQLDDAFNLLARQSEIGLDADGIEPVLGDYAVNTALIRLTDSTPPSAFCPLPSARQAASGRDIFWRFFHAKFRGRTKAQLLACPSGAQC